MSTEKTLNGTFFDFNYNMLALMYGIEEYNRAQQFKAIAHRKRYWHDHQGQPHRNPTMRPLLQNGKAPR